MRQIRGFHVGEVLRASIAVYGQNWRTLVVFALVTYLPLFVLMAFHPLPDPPAPPENPEQMREFMAVLWPEWRVFYQSLVWYALVSSLCYCWMLGGVTYLVVRALRGNPPTLRQAMWQSLRAIPRVVVVTFLVGLATVFAMLLLIVPGVIVALMLWVALPAAIVEHRYSSALRRSYDLTLGHKVPILGLAILLIVAGFACTTVVSAIMSDWAPRFSVLTDVVVSAATASIGAVVGAVCYHDLRVLKEGGGSSAVARVFE